MPIVTLDNVDHDFPEVSTVADLAELVQRTNDLQSHLCGKGFEFVTRYQGNLADEYDFTEFLIDADSIPERVHLVIYSSTYCDASPVDSGIQFGGGCSGQFVVNVMFGRCLFKYAGVCTTKDLKEALKTKGALRQHVLGKVFDLIEYKRDRNSKGNQLDAYDSTEILQDCASLPGTVILAIGGSSSSCSIT